MLESSQQSFPGGSEGKGSTCNSGSTPGREDPLEKEMTTHSSILAWRIPWTEAACMELQRVRQDGATDTSTFTWPSLFTAPQPYRARIHSPPDSRPTQAATQHPAELREAALSPGNSVAGGGGGGNQSLADGCVGSLKAQAPGARSGG